MRPIEFRRPFIALLKVREASDTHARLQAIPHHDSASICIAGQICMHTAGNRVGVQQGTDRVRGPQDPADPASLNSKRAPLSRLQTRIVHRPPWQLSSCQTGTASFLSNDSRPEGRECQTAAGSPGDARRACQRLSRRAGLMQRCSLLSDSSKIS